MQQLTLQHQIVKTFVAFTYSLKYTFSMLVHRLKSTNFIFCTEI